MMARSLVLFLNLLTLAYCGCQTIPKKTAVCDCSDRKVQDSLVEKYIEKGAHALPYLYNDSRWISYCDSVIALCPNLAYAYQQKAIPFIKNGEYEKAFLLENKAVELDPKTYTSYRGFLKCIFTKDYEGAIVDFQKAQQLTPNSYEMDHTYLFYEGLSNLELGNYPEAEKKFQQDIFIQTQGDTTQNPHFNTLFYFGVLYYEMKNYPLAKKYLLKCISEYKEHTNANYYLAMVYLEEKKWYLAEKYLKISAQAFEEGYGINEDNVYYANYPHQIRLYEVEQAMAKTKSNNYLSGDIKDSLINLLFIIDEEDQKHRNQIDYTQEKFGSDSKEMKELFSKMKKADSMNLVPVSLILDSYGWLGANEIGQQGNTTLFMVIQHSDIKTQEKYLPQMRKAVKDGKAKAGQLALLEDRVALLQGKKQIYGSQITWNMKTNTYCIAPLNDPDNVDIRRAEVGLPPLADYLIEMDIIWDLEQYKKDLPDIESEFFKKK